MDDKLVKVQPQSHMTNTSKVGDAHQDLPFVQLDQFAVSMLPNETVHNLADKAT